MNFKRYFCNSSNTRFRLTDRKPYLPAHERMVWRPHGSRSVAVYGFREGLFNIWLKLCFKLCALNYVFRQLNVHPGEHVVAISLDVANAFNSLPWFIRETLEKCHFPDYLCRIIDGYLFENTDPWLRECHRALFSLPPLRIISYTIVFLKS